ncbi:beta-L-arabinofuranosidase domain-containing protein [Catenuloplanes japonicus]|uniref:beta-L-arabinofuranosidase domain-containing protein n=1 Tax=Catenuloplanes japonicus TaxID=33876 RepID=UPI00052685E3|nr:beta-L-arabinofuranosidase domain-containing protein [Catenuloplanes japonicus]
MKRRTVFALGAFAGAAGALSSSPAAALPAPGVAAAPGGGADKIDTVPLNRVRLTDSRYRQNMARTAAYLRFVDVDRLLHTFRLNYGLPSTAEPLGGWEAPNVLLRGHTTGHLLSGLAQAAANLGDAELTAKSARIVAALAEIQAAAPAAGFTTGYLSAFPEQVFTDLEGGANPWAPYYTVHKIFAGLLDQHRLLGNAQALAVARGIADWADARTGALSRETMQRVLHVEFGGMNESFVNLWRVTGDPRHLALARRFDHDEIFTPLAERRDTLTGRHANTDIPKVVGAAAAWSATGEARYGTIATYFWEQVVRHHSYVIGGNSNAEFFGPPDQVVSQLGENTCENCNSYNMLKLTRLLWLRDPGRTDYLDYYEWTLLNQMLGEQDPDSAHGNVTYYTGLSQGTRRQGKSGLVSDPGSYSSDYGNFSCDHGSGLETQTKFAENIFAESGDTLHVNLFIPAETGFRGARVALTTHYPYDETVRLTVTGKSAEFTLKVRIPGWADRPSLHVNGVKTQATPGSFATVRRRWRNGDVVELRLPMTPRWREAPDNPAVKALTYGPLVLAARHGSAAVPVIPTVDAATLRREPGKVEFSVVAAGQRLRMSPFLDVHHENYSVYVAIPPARPVASKLAAYPLNGSVKEKHRRWGDAVLVGGAALGARGVELDGLNGHVVLPAGLPANATGLTAEAWVRLDSIANSARVFDLGFNVNSYFFLTARTGAGKARAALKLGGMDGEDFVDAAVALPTGVWTHVAVSAGTTLRIYIDGELSGENLAPRMGPLLLGATQFNYLGRSQNVKHPYLHGAIADFRLHGRELTPAQL